MDAKGRMVLPSKIKAKLPESHNKEVVVTRGLDPCLVVYAMPEWNKKVAKVSSLNENASQVSFDNFEKLFDFNLSALPFLRFIPAQCE